MDLTSSVCLLTLLGIPELLSFQSNHLVWWSNFRIELVGFLFNDVQCLCLFVAIQWKEWIFARGDSDALEMDRRSWLWRRKSSEKSPGETESSGSISSHSERFSDDQVGSILGFEFLAHCYPLNLFFNWKKKRIKEEWMGVIFGYWNGFSQLRIFFLCCICHVLPLVSNYVLLLIFPSSQKIHSKGISQTNPAVLILG